MLLQELKLKNIRSYTEETINFQEGSLILSGDIGSGKSSILLAVEFALFGTSRPDLPAESLLRKGTSQGSVELSFLVHDKQIRIKRNLKKDKNSIKQTAGHLIINNTKKELMPIELKAEIISILGYPEDLLAKNKNYIFRYTIYTPQEEMKKILEETSEIRQEVLRKIFNIDKYQIIRENIQEYLRKLRTKMAVIKTKLEPLEEKKQESKQIFQEKKEVQEQLQKNEPRKKDLAVKIGQQKEKINSLEERQDKFIKAQQRIKELSSLINEKRLQKQKQKKKKEEIVQQIISLSLPDDFMTGKIKEELEQIKEEKNKFFQLKTVCQEKINRLQERIKELQEEIFSLEQETIFLEDKEKIEKKLQEEAIEKEEIEREKIELERLLEEIITTITKNKSLLAYAQELKDKINSLGTCPTCLQEVSSTYKENISNREEEKIKRLEKFLWEININKEEILQKRKKLFLKEKENIQKERELMQIKIEIKQLREKKRLLNFKKEQLKISAQENNLLMQKLRIMLTENQMEQLSQQEQKKQELLNLYEQKKFLNEQKKETALLIKNLEEETIVLEKELNQILEENINKQDLSVEINKERNLLAEQNEKERKISIAVAQLQIRLEHFIQQETRINQEIKKLVYEKNMFLHYQENHHWLEGHFLPLTYTIEKQIMLNIHQLFNQLFQEWFSILIQDDNITAHLDDSFTPVIVQNGYDISFTTLSGGEKTSAALAYRLALNKVINDVIQSIKTKDLLILDEPTDGFSTEQLDKIRDVLERINLKQVIIVSHESKIESFVDKVIRIQKERHISSVI